MDNISVCIRIRPLNPFKEQTDVWTYDEHSISQQRSSTQYNFGNQDNYAISVYLPFFRSNFWPRCWNTSNLPKYCKTHCPLSNGWDKW